MIRHSIFISMALLFVAVPTAFAQLQAVIPEEDLPNAKVYFPIGVSGLDPGYGSNAAALDSIVRGVNRLLADPDVIFQAVVVETGASPDGSYELNEKLAMDRARSIRKYLLDHLALSSVQVKAFSVGVDWEGLNTLVQASGSGWRDDVLRVIADCGVRMNADRASSERCLRQLRQLDGGRAWAWMMDELFPKLRQGSGDIRCVVYREPKVIAGGSVRDTLVIVHEYEGGGSGVDAAAVNAIIDSRERRVRGYRNDSLFRVPALAFRTNLLLPLMNVGVEVPLGNRWSISADVYAPWIWRAWSDAFLTPNKQCFQVNSAYVDVRCWFGKTHRRGKEYRKYKLLGHSLGVFATGGYFDLEKDWEGTQGEYVGAGVSYLYALPMGRRGGTHLEFEIGAGYCFIRERPYTMLEDSGHAISHEVENYPGGFFPMKACVSLVVPIFVRDPKAGKEGGR